MNSENAIEVKNVKKRFKVYLDKGNSMKEKVLFRSRNRYENRWVLNGISFNVKKGEAIGLIGKNGCGKSTTLKMLTRIMYPTEGSIELRGRVSSLIELGAGFHPDMSGRENIFTNASIFGLNHAEIEGRLDDIIRFSELEEFIDNPVRTYSSGMYMRLAFAVAINVDADILLIDEILAVGDVSFQAKCFEKLQEIKRNGTTIVIVSHVMGQIEQICDKAIWIEEGLIREEGKPKVVGQHYLESMEEKRVERLESEFREEVKKREERQKREDRKKVEKQKREVQILPDFCRKGAKIKGSREIEFIDARIINQEGKQTLWIKTGEEFTIQMQYVSHESGLGKSIDFIVGITREDGVYCFGTGMLSGYYEQEIHAKEKGLIKLTIKNPFLKGHYLLDIAVQDREGNPFEYINSALEFRVAGENEYQVGLTQVSRKWEMDGRKFEMIQ